MLGRRDRFGLNRQHLQPLGMNGCNRQGKTTVTAYWCTVRGSSVAVHGCLLTVSVNDRTTLLLLGTLIPKGSSKNRTFDIYRFGLIIVTNLKHLSFIRIEKNMISFSVLAPSYSSRNPANRLFLYFMLVTACGQITGQMRAILSIVQTPRLPVVTQIQPRSSAVHRLQLCRRLKR